MKKNNKLDVWVISRVSVFLNESISGTQGNLVEWFLNDGSEVLINFDTKEIGFVNWIGDDKTYFSIIGVGLSQGFTTHDYFTEK
jgi:hypothetical protein